MQARLTEFEAVLFFGGEPGLRFPGLVHELNAALAPLGVEFEAESLVGEGFAFFTHPAMHLIVALNRVPMEAAALKGMAPEDDATAAALAAHRRTIRVTLGDGAHFGSAAHRAEVPAARKLQVLFRAVLALIGTERPDAVLWAQSGRIVAPETVEAAANAPFPAALAFHAQPVAQAAPGELVETAIAARGSETLIGRKLVLVPGPLAPKAAEDLAEKLLMLEAMEPGTLAEGKAIPCSETRSLTVSASPDGKLVVRCVDSAALAETDEAEAPEVLPRDRLVGLRDMRIPTYSLCAMLGLLMPVAGAALALWNVVRGPNLTVTGLAALLMAMGYILAGTSFFFPESQVAAALLMR